MRFAWLSLAGSTILIAGCSIAPMATMQPPMSPPGSTTGGTSVRGRIHGGQQGISGAHVYMYALGTSGYGTLAVPQPSQSRLTTGPDTQQDSNGNYYVTTAGDGAFTITTADYQCGVVGGNPVTEQVYLYSIGGQPGSDATTNSYAGLMAVLGPCTNSSFTGLPASVQMNEVTTVAAAYALAGFAIDATDISANASTPAVFVANAAANAGNLADLGSGLAQTTTPGGNGTVPATTINTLADILSACINATSPSYGSSEPPGVMDPCNTLVTNATADGTPTGTQPKDTATAAINIAHHPGANVATLFGLATATAPFEPILSGTGMYSPNDWTIAIVYTGGGIDEPSFLAIDGSGNVWTSNLEDATISEFSPLGAPFVSSPYSGGGLSEPQGIAVDTVGNVWVANEDGGEGSIGSVSEYSSGTWTTYTDPGLGGPYYIAIDGSNNVWIANNGNNTISAFNASFSTTQAVYETAPGDATTNGLAGPFGIAVDSANNQWVANYSGTSVSEFTVTLGILAADPPAITGGDLDAPQSLAVDGSGNVWVANSIGNDITEIVPGTPPTATGITGGGISAPYGIAIDGLGNVWTTNESTISSLSEVSNAGGPPAAVSPDGGYQGTTATSPYGAVLTNPVDLAIDGSGNVWVVDVQYTDGPLSFPDNVVEFVGAAAPVVTPLALGVKNGLGARP
jgi:hypothetical protein